MATLAQRNYLAANPGWMNEQVYQFAPGTPYSNWMYNPTLDQILRAGGEISAFNQIAPVHQNRIKAGPDWAQLSQWLAPTPTPTPLAATTTPQTQPAAQDRFNITEGPFAGWYWSWEHDLFYDLQDKPHGLGSDPALFLEWRENDWWDDFTALYMGRYNIPPPQYEKLFPEKPGEPPPPEYEGPQDPRAGLPDEPVQPPVSGEPPLLPYHPPPTEPPTDQWSDAQERWGKTEAQKTFLAANPEWGNLEGMVRGPEGTRFTNWWWNPDTQQFLTAGGDVRAWTDLAKVAQTDLQATAGWSDLGVQTEAPTEPQVPPAYEPPPTEPLLPYHPPPTEPPPTSGIESYAPGNLPDQSVVPAGVGPYGTPAYPEPMWPVDWREKKMDYGREVGAPGTGQFRTPTPWGEPIGGPIGGTTGIPEPITPEPGTLPDLSGALGTTAATGGWGPSGQSGYPEWPGKDIGTAAEQQQYINYLNSMLGWVQEQARKNEWGAQFNEDWRKWNQDYESNMDNLLWQQAQAKAVFLEEARLHGLAYAKDAAASKGFAVDYNYETGELTVTTDPTLEAAVLGGLTIGPGGEYIRTETATAAAGEAIIGTNADGSPIYGKSAKTVQDEWDNKLAVWLAQGKLPIIQADGEMARNPDGTVMFAPTLEKTEMLLQELGYRTNPNTGQIEYTPEYMKTMGTLTGYVPGQPSTPGDSGALGMPAYPGGPTTGIPDPQFPYLPVPPTGPPTPTQTMTAAEREAQARRQMDWADLMGQYQGTPTQQAYEYGRTQTEAEKARLAADLYKRSESTGYWGQGATTGQTHMLDPDTGQPMYDPKTGQPKMTGGDWGVPDQQKTLGYRDWEQRQQQQQWAQETQFPQQLEHEQQLGAMSAFGRWRKPNPRWL